MKVVISHELPIERFALTELIKSVTISTSINAAESVPLPNSVGDVDLWVCSATLLEHMSSEELASYIGPEVAAKLCIYGESNKPTLLKFILNSRIQVISPKFHVRLVCEVIAKIIGIKTDELAQPSQLLPLTPRQVDVMQLISKNLTVREIAKAMDLSPSMVTSYIDTATYRLGCTSKEQAISAFEATYTKSNQS